MNALRLATVSAISLTLASCYSLKEPSMQEAHSHGFCNTITQGVYDAIKRGDDLGVDGTKFGIALSRSIDKAFPLPPAEWDTRLQVIWKAGVYTGRELRLKLDNRMVLSEADVKNIQECADWVDTIS